MQQYGFLIESWAQAVWETDADGVVVADSPSWRAYTGQTLNEWLGYGWLGAVHPEDRAFAERQWREGIAARRLVDAEFRLRAPDGWRWTNVRAAPDLDAGGRVEKWVGMNIDIDARKRTEAALRESEERHRSLFEAMDEAYAVVEVLRDETGAWSDFRFLNVNPAFMKHTSMPYPVGKTATELLGAPNPRWAQMYGQALDTGEPIRVQEPEPTLERIFDLNIFSLDRERNRVAVLFSDIVERTRAETALKEAEERLRQFGEASQDVLWIRDVETLQWTYLSPAFEAIYGLSREVALSGDDYRNWQELILPEDRAHAVESIERVIQGEQVAFEYRIRRPADGETRWLRNTDFPMRDIDGQVRRIGGVGHDATELKRIEEALRDSESRLRVLMEGVPQLIWRSGNDGLWTWSSPQWLDYTGQAQEESHGWGWLDAVHPNDRGVAGEAWRDARLHGRLDVEYRVRRASDGAWRWHQTRSVPVREEPKLDGGHTPILEWLGTTTDIEDLKRLQGQQQVLVAELQHRTRNLLAVVRNIAKRSINPSPGRDEYDARLAALGRVQGFLSRSTLYMVSLADLVEAELEAAGDGACDKVVVGGPPVELPGSGVQAVALALHELATNAVKYGAIAHPSGQLSVSWVIEAGDTPGSERLVIDWRESKVTMPPGPPSRRGYGSELITRALPYQLHAETLLEFTDDGVRCRISLPSVCFSVAVPEEQV